MKNSKILNFITITLSGMANGLFATLIIGTIISTIGSIFAINPSNPFLAFMAESLGTNNPPSTGLSLVLKNLTGAGIGIGIALSLKFDTLKTIVLGTVGETAAYFSMGADKETQLPIISNSIKVGDPLTIYLVCILTALLIMLIFKKKTSVDILIIPLLGCIIGLFASLGLRYPSAYITYGIQWIIAKGTTTVPFLMGIIVAVLMGMALTAPISSAAIAATIFTQAALAENEFVAIAGGAALIGCCCQMVGFAIQSRKDNGIGTVFAIGIGTSMLQFKNILKKPIIWLPTIIASAILGPISTTVIKMKCMGTACGMGTSGLVGQIGSIDSLYGLGDYRTWLVLIGFQVVLPIILVFFIDLLFRKLKWIKEGDLKL